MDYTDLGTIAGISAAATVIVALIKGGITVSGRATHVLTVLHRPFGAGED